MIEVKVYKPRCSECSNHLIYKESVSRKVKGAMLRCGCRYCTAGSKYRAFRSSDPKVYVPKWCPKLLKQPVLRIYCFKNSEAWYFQQLYKSWGHKPNPMERDYALRMESTTIYSAKTFHDLLKTNTLKELLQTDAHTTEIIEIDDGIRPYCFYYGEDYTVRAINFSGEKARANKLEVTPSSD